MGPLSELAGRSATPMTHPSSREMFRYWNALRGQRRAPEGVAKTDLARPASLLGAEQACALNPHPPEREGLYTGR